MMNKYKVSRARDSYIHKVKLAQLVEFAFHENVKN